jgi:hypothetical protein
MLDGASAQERQRIADSSVGPSLWFVFVVNSLTGIVLTQPYLLLPFWILMLFPMIVRPGGRGDASQA